MKESSEKAMKIYIELRFNAVEQQYDKTFNLKSDIDDSDGVHSNQNPHEKIGLCV